MTVTMAVTVTMTVVMTRVLAGLLGREHRIEGRHHRQGKADGDHAPQKRARVGITRDQIPLMIHHAAQRYQCSGRSEAAWLQGARPGAVRPRTQTPR
jgi:hypothetical protein